MPPSEKPESNPFLAQHLPVQNLRFVEEKEIQGRKTKVYESEDGSLFHEIKKNQMPERQMFTSLLLKGVAHVADVITDEDGIYYSKDMLSGLSDVIKTGKPEVYADLILLSAIFNDKDHSFGKFPHNIATNDNTHSIFDFDGRHRGRKPNIGEYFAKNTFEHFLLEELTAVPEEYVTETVGVFKKKVEQLISLYESEEGLVTFDAIIQKSNLPGVENVAQLYSNFISHLHFLLVFDDMKLRRLITRSS